MKKLMRLLKQYPYIYRWVLYFRFSLKGHLFSDETFLKRQFKKRNGRTLNLESPRAINDKLVWLNLHWESDLARLCCDKYLVRQYVAEQIGEEVLNKIYGVYDAVAEIDLSALPDRFILKTTHGSGWNIVCKDKSNFDWKTARINLDTWMHLDYYHQNREALYRGLKPRIICERHLPVEPDEVIDYKLFCLNGKPYCTFVCFDRSKGLKVDYYDLDWNKHPIQKNYPTSDITLPRPSHYDQMLEYAEILATPFPFVRVDFYEAWDKVIFGELTFFPEVGMGPYTPESHDYLLGEMLTLPASNKN